MVDKPNERKLHTTPIPAIGGFVAVICLLITAFFSPLMQTFIAQHYTIFIPMLVLTVTGFLDDRWNLPVKLRLLMQLGCAITVAAGGTKITSLYGFMAIWDLSLPIQYLLTVTIIMGVVNAFNLMDGIDGLLGGIGIVNLVVIAVMSILAAQTEWLYLVFPLIVILALFLTYNLKSARVFMGDSGSLMLGLLIAGAGIHFIQIAKAQAPELASLFIVLVTASCMVAVLDSIRVYLSRLSKGKSAFAADKTHLHHLLIQNYLVHANATAKILRLQVALLLASAAASFVLSISLIIFGQLLFIFGYIYSLQLITQFYRWYRMIKKMENEI